MRYGGILFSAAALAALPALAPATAEPAPADIASQGSTATVTEVRHSGRSSHGAPYPLVPAEVVLPGKRGLPQEVEGTTAEVTVRYAGPSASEAPYPLVPADVVLPGKRGLPREAQGIPSARR